MQAFKRFRINLTRPTLTVVRVWEADPPAGAEALEWILGTDLADQSAEGLLRYCAWSEWRWPTMEEYHMAQKTGLGIEKLRGVCWRGSCC